MSESTPHEDVCDAIVRTQQLEERLHESVETLEAANEILERNADPAKLPKLLR